MSSLKRFFTDRGWHQVRGENFKACAEEDEKITVVSEREDGFCLECELLIQPSYSLTDDLRRMLETDRVQIADLRVNQSSTTLVIRIF